MAGVPMYRHLGVLWCLGSWFGAEGTDGCIFRGGADKSKPVWAIMVVL